MVLGDAKHMWRKQLSKDMYLFQGFDMQYFMAGMRHGRGERAIALARKRKKKTTRLSCGSTISAFYTSSTPPRHTCRPPAPLTRSEGEH